MELVTIATFDTPPRAHLAVGLLREAGIDARLRNEHIVAGAWDLGQASRGVEVRVPREDAQRAFALVEQATFHGGVPHEADDDEQEAEHGADEPDARTAAQREDEARADRALKAAGFGILFPPLQVYSLWLLLELAPRPSRDRATPLTRRRARTALLLDLVVVAIAVAVLVAE